MRRPQSFAISPSSARVASGTRFWTLPGSVLGAFSPSRCLQDRPKSVQDASKNPQEASKIAPRAPKRPPRLPQERQSCCPAAFQIAKSRHTPLAHTSEN